MLLPNASFINCFSLGIFLDGRDKNTEEQKIVLSFRYGNYCLIIIVISILFVVIYEILFT